MIDITAVQDILIESIRGIVPNTTSWLGVIDDLVLDAQKSLPACRVTYTGTTFTHQEGSHKVLTHADVTFDVYVVVRNLRTKTEMFSEAHQILDEIRKAMHGRKISMDGTVVLKIMREELIMQQSSISVYSQTYTYRDRLIGVGYENSSK